MRKFIQNKLKDQKGLTLIELLAVIVILAIIAAIAVPAIGNIINNSRHNAVKADFQNVLSAGNLYFTDNGSANGDTFIDTTATASDYVDVKGSIQTFIVTKANGGNTISGTALLKGKTYTIAAPGITNTTLNGKSASDMAALITAP